MAGVSETRVLNDILSTTLATMSGDLQDQIFDTYPLLSYLNGKLGSTLSSASVNPKVMETGGESITIPAVYDQNSTVGSYAGADVIDTSLQDGITLARYQFKQYAGVLGITGIDLLKNSGDAAIVKLLDAKKMQAIMTMKDKMSRDAWSDGTGNSGKDLTGMQAIVDSTGTVGGLDQATYNWWASYEKDTVAFSAAGKTEMTKAINTLTIGQDTPDLILTTQEVYQFLRTSIDSAERFANTEIANIGFTTITFDGVPVMFDRDCPAGEMYFLNSRYLKMHVMAAADLVIRPFVEPDNQDVRIAKILWAGNMLTNNRRRLGKITTITA